MITSLPNGTLIVFTQNGSQDIWRVSKGETDATTGYTGPGRPVLPGDVVHKVIWRGSEIHVRRVYTIQPGDVDCRQFTSHLLTGKPIVCYNNRLRRKI